MLEFQEKRKFKRFIYSRLVAIFLLIILFFVLREVWGVYQKERFTKENLDRVESSLGDLQAREARLTYELAKLKTAGGQEDEIRERYGYVRPGEEVIVIVDDDIRKAKELILPDERSVWDKLLNWLKIR